MTRPECQKLRDKLHGYRLGEGTPLERQKLELHLKKCAGCNNELYLLHELEQAARVGPPALTDGEKRNILNNIHRTIRQEESPRLEIKTSFDWRKWFAMPAAGLACAAALMMVLSKPIENTTDVEIAPAQIAATTPAMEAAPRLKVDQVLEVGPGVVAFQTKSTKTLVRQRGTARTIDLSRGAVVAEFNREKGQEPLEIVTPHATIVIRGTVFAINTNMRSTTVAVNRGKVEVRSNNGDITMLLAGESLEVGQASQDVETETKPLQMAMNDHFGPESPEEPKEEPETEEPQAGLTPSPALDADSEQANGYSPTPTRAPSATKAIQKQAMQAKPLPKPEEKKSKTRTAARATAMELLSSARTLWRNQDHDLAIDALKQLLAGDEVRNLTATERSEARYLLATIHRDVGDYGRSATLLRVVAKQDLGITGRMAQLELARIEARHLGHQVKAQEILEALVTTGTLDIVAEEGLFELCALYIKTSQWPQAKKCLQNFLTKFSESERSAEAQSLLNNLPKL